MTLYFGSKPFGTRRIVASFGIALLLSTASLTAQEPNPEQQFSDAQLNLLLESRTQKPAAEATAAERASAMEELSNIYLVSDLPRAKELAQDPAIQAQLKLQERAMMYNLYATEFLTATEPTDQEVFNVYQEQVAVAPPKEFKARHILVDTQSAALTLIDQLKDGEDFAELAKANSTGPSAPSGGDLGWFSAQAMVKPFSDAVSVMEDGAYTSAPVQTNFGWHVILREDSRDSIPPPLDNVRDIIVQRIAQQKFQDFLKRLRENAAK